jgi:hypothetical protein
MVKKAQMFVITMVFLAGLVFFVQQLLLQYSAVDVSNFPKNDDYYMITNIVEVVNDTIKSSETCDEALNRINELDKFLKEREAGNYIITVKYNKKSYPNLICSAFNNTIGNETALTLDIRVISGNAETEGVFYFYK